MINKYLVFEIFWEQLRADYQFKPLARSIHATIVNMYKMNGRHHHGTDHINFCLKTLLEMPYSDFVSSKSGYGKRTYFFALFFHDCFYIAGCKSNERLSADIAISCLTQLGLSDGFIHDVDRYIMVTTHQNEPKKADEWMIADIDLAVLSQPWQKFIEATEKIAQEFKFLCSREEFISGQKDFMKRFLKRKIYGTPFFEPYEEFAVENITRLINEYK